MLFPHIGRDRKVANEVLKGLYILFHTVNILRYSPNALFTELVSVEVIRLPESGTGQIQLGYIYERGDREQRLENFRDLYDRYLGVRLKVTSES